MRRRLKVGIGIAAALLALLLLNAFWVGDETKGTSVTVEGGRILELPYGDLQVAEYGSRAGQPIVLLHCYTCAMDWWDGMLPHLQPGHRVIALDLLGHGGSEKPGDGYTPANQARAVAAALERLRVEDATVVGHSLGGAVGVALSEQSPELVDRLVIVDMPPDNTYDDGFGLSAALSFMPVVGEALWRVKPDFSVRDGLEVAFAPGFEVPDRFVEDLKRLTYTAYDETPGRNEEFLEDESLDRRMRATGKPLMVLIGAEEQLIDDPQRALDQYRAGANAETHLIADAGHSPNVERPYLTAKLVLRFAKKASKDIGSSVRDVTERGEQPQRSSRKASAERASGVRSATGGQ